MTITEQMEEAQHELAAEAFLERRVEKELAQKELDAGRTTDEFGRIIDMNAGLPKDLFVQTPKEIGQEDETTIQ